MQITEIVAISLVARSELSGTMNGPSSVALLQYNLQCKSVLQGP